MRTYNANERHVLANHVRTTGRSIQDMMGQLESGYGEMGRELAKTLTYALVRYHGDAVVFLPEESFLRRDLIRIHDGEKGYLEISGKYNGYYGAMMLRWNPDTEEWSYSINT